MVTFVVETTSGGRKRVRETSAITEAYQFARETPDSVVELRSGHGWILKSAYYSAKHPLPEFADFQRWVRAAKVRAKNPTNRERPTGRYTYDPAKKCKCGHKLGDHTAEGRLAEKSCTVMGCRCEGFRYMRKKTARRANPSRQGYKVFKVQGYDVRFLGSVTGPTAITIRWFPTPGDATRFPTKGKALAVAQHQAEKFVGADWKVGVTPYGTTIPAIVESTRGKA